MEIGEVFLALAGILLFFDFVLLSLKAEKRLRLAFYVSTIACALIVASYLRLTLAFLNDNFLLSEVFMYSSSSLSTIYKIGDPWISSAGSFLFITFLLAIIYLVYRFKTFGKETVFRTTSYKILDIFLIFFIFANFLKSPFERLPMAPSEGTGLNPLLQTLWVIPHPPVVFLGYVFVFFAFALMLARMITSEGEGQETSLKRALYAAWLFLALGIALGGWWSYEVLGWGGYWAWDPVETASLLPWLALTAYFHLSGRRKDMAKELTLTITFFMVIFATALTRGGLLESVHAFGRSPIGPVLLGFAFCAVFYFLYLARGANKPLYTFDVNTSSLFSISIFVAYWSLMLLLIICFLGDAAPIIGGLFTGNPMTTGMEFYNRWCFPFTLAFVAALIGCNSALKMKKYAMLITPTLVIGAILVLLELTPNPLANFGLPLLLVAGIAIAYNFARLAQKKVSLRLCGKTLVHLAIVVILIGVFVSSAAKTESDKILTSPNSVIETMGTRIELDNFTVYPGAGSVYSGKAFHRALPEYSALKMDISVGEEGKVHHESLWMYYYTNYGVVSKPLIISTPTGDIYVSMHYTNSSYDSLYHALMGERNPPKSIFIHVKKIPLVWLVWGGVILLGSGMTASLISDLKSRK